MNSIIVVEAVRNNTWTGKAVMEGEEHPFTLDSATGEYQVDKESINKVDWTFVMKSLLPNHSVKMV